MGIAIKVLYGLKYKQRWKLMLKNCGHSVKWKELAVNRTLLVMIKRRANTFFIDCSAESPIKLSSLVSDLFGLSARRMLKALADGETNPASLAALADERLRATPEQLCDALGACTELNAVYRRLLKMALEELRLIDEQIGQLDQEMASLPSQQPDAVERLAEVPGLGVDSAQQIIA